MSDEAKAVKSGHFTQLRQPLSGFPVGWKREEVWKVEVRIGRNAFLSRTDYASEEAAKSAAKRLLPSVQAINKGSSE